ncbi:hypothetical protein DL771_000067 [Monosporascus sp. 5C6A]|nr:hypothetical protein DL771_000067 [Monosporascus sp. 5C6A]
MEKGKGKQTNTSGWTPVNQPSGPLAMPLRPVVIDSDPPSDTLEEDAASLVGGISDNALGDDSPPKKPDQKRKKKERSSSSGSSSAFSIEGVRAKYKKRRILTLYHDQPRSYAHTFIPELRDRARKAGYKDLKVPLDEYGIAATTLNALPDEIQACTPLWNLKSKFMVFMGDMHLRLVEKHFSYDLNPDTNNLVATQNYDLKTHALKHGYIHYQQLKGLLSQLGVDSDRYVSWDGETVQTPSFRKNVGTDICELLDAFGLEKGKHYSCDNQTLPTFLEKPDLDRHAVVTKFLEAFKNLGLREGEHYKIENDEPIVLKKAVPDSQAPSDPQKTSPWINLDEGALFEVKNGLPVRVQSTVTHPNYKHIFDKLDLQENKHYRLVEGREPIILMDHHGQILTNDSERAETRKVFQKVHDLILNGLSVLPTEIFRFLVDHNELTDPLEFIKGFHEAFSKLLERVLGLIKDLERYGENVKLITEPARDEMLGHLTYLFLESDLTNAFGGKTVWDETWANLTAPQAKFRRRSLQKIAVSSRSVFSYFLAVSLSLSRLRVSLDESAAEGSKLGDGLYSSGPVKELWNAMLRLGEPDNSLELGTDDWSKLSVDSDFGYLTSPLTPGLLDYILDDQRPAIRHVARLEIKKVLLEGLFAAGN